MGHSITRVKVVIRTLRPHKVRLASGIDSSIGARLLAFGRESQADQGKTVLSVEPINQAGYIKARSINMHRRNLVHRNTQISVSGFCVMWWIIDYASINAVTMGHRREPSSSGTKWPMSSKVVVWAL